MGKLDFVSEFRRKYLKNAPYDINYTHPRTKANYPKILTDEIEHDPLQPDEEFNFQEYSKAIADIIKGSEPRFSIGIYGEWGSGKTTLMRLIENRLRPTIFLWENIPDLSAQNQSLRNYLKENFELNDVESLGITKTKDGKTIELSDQK